ncbi:MAG: ABC transporter ATP-binding protein [Blastocatellia bacterium]|nr:ABC transporter ATP-binding protein [Blastocatellia bacterium]
MKPSDGNNNPNRSVNDAPLVSLRQVGKNYATPAGRFTALQNIDLDIQAGEFVALVGKSGSGKSTLLNLMSGIDRPSQGEVRVGGAELHQMSETGLARWRGLHVGVVFQFFQLLPTLTVVENVMLPMDFCHVRAPRQRRERALELLKLVGIVEQAEKLPATLSGGQQQRAAIARALANEPPLIIADEPTGNLDTGTAEAVLDLFRNLVGRGTTLVIATHERNLAGIDRTVELVDGKIANSARIPTAQLTQEVLA